MPSARSHYAHLRDGPILIPFPSGDLLAALAPLLAASFALDEGTKRRYVVDSAPGQLGYSPPLLEGDPRPGHGDWKEMWNWRREQLRPQALARTVPETRTDAIVNEPVPGLATLLAELEAVLNTVRDEVCVELAAVLGVDAQFLIELLTDGPHLTRAVNYLPIDVADTVNAEWARDHVDISLFTLVLLETDRGLECLTSEGWRDTVVPESFALVKAGKMLEILSNGGFPAVRHRVGAPTAEASRMSLVHFAQPAEWYIIGPLSHWVSVQRPLRFPAMRAVDAFRRQLEVAGILGEDNFT